MTMAIFETDIELEADIIMADTANRLALVADSIPADGSQNTHHTKDILDEGNADIAKGLVKRFVFECMDLLYPYTKTPMRRIRRSDSNEDICAYVIHLTFERPRSETSLQRLARLVHDYVVYKCMSEWLDMTEHASKAAGTWVDKADEVREQIATTLALPYNPKTLRVKPRWYY